MTEDDASGMLTSSAPLLSTATASRLHPSTRFTRLHSPYGLLTTHKASSTVLYVFSAHCLTSTDR